MKIFIEEFKAFAMKGNVIELAVAVVIGTAFGKIVSSLVTNIITPFLGILLGGIDFSNLQLVVGDTAITYGVFIQSIVDFVIISLVIFLAIKAVSRLHEKEEAKPVAEKIVEPSAEVKLLTEIRDSLSR
ncbi:large conductance mechanosensitive channel protein MscL [Candidatus Kaiserbacteria bacterium CG_4_9_14_0_2_um_filter_41_32]|uniref:Large-conductance mechanosensitive channel n=1 Tax=Candidatus Kaiserbacteria bacterium CG_4_9_14_0_2_um_filter_41_32 TaxID=1974601 RepID=A0A2M8FFF1_9BACT|nr:MAG: large conductance mechanosensitive channel protein MscL [Candidatus Kaiserbacteria bacterium CG_4_9_14_0_2_um_filter_41_32]